METKNRCMGCMEDKGSLEVCPFCGYDESGSLSPLILSPRTPLLHDQYLMGRILGKLGGIGITYLGWDVNLETKVAVKEYLPRDLVGRANDRKTVVPHHSDEKGLFKFGLECFLQEARTLAKFSHPNVVRVRAFFEENLTAYLVMDYYEGVSLVQFLKDKGGCIEENLALEIMLPIMDGLREVHDRGFLHRDIRPRNIYLTERGVPILLDFGSARFALEKRSLSVPVALSPGYSPYEQYHKKGKQGVWSDIYSAAATLYRMLSGTPPLDASDRIMADDLVPIKTLVPEISPQLNDAIMQALSVKTGDRPQSMKKFQDLIIKDREHLFEDPSQRFAIDDAVCRFAKELGTPEALELYLKQFPAGNHSEEVQSLLVQVNKKQRKPKPGEAKKLKEQNKSEVKVEEQGKVELNRGKGLEEPGIRTEAEEEAAGEKAKIKEPQEIPEKPLTIEYNLTFACETQKSGFIVSSGALKRQGEESILVWEEDDYLKDKFPRASRNQKGFWESDFTGYSPVGFELPMVYIPAGEFVMGSDDREAEIDEEPVHNVFLHGYWLGKYEVTFAKFDIFCRETGLYTNPGAVSDKKRPADVGWGRGELPVINVSWNDAVEFCKWVSAKTGLRFQLPTEAQWEKAARGTDMRKYCWGNNPPGRGLVNFKESQMGRTTPVTQFPGDISPYGVMGMSGNVWEWCRDWYSEDYYKNSPAMNPEGPAKGMTRVKRGGSWDANERGLRCTYRNSSYSAYRDYNLGFRLCVEGSTS
jgi:formylglycine-generating enzyme required for sulfatase activity/tRNA A-37 threonylcarbamoyl transferase component Bud32